MQGMRPGDLCVLNSGAPTYLMRGHAWPSEQAGHLNDVDVIVILSIVHAPRACGKRQCLVLQNERLGWTYEDRLLLLRRVNA